MKANLKDRAITLRREGYSYSEIRQEVSVAKSTLSLWLRSVGLSRKQKQTLTKKRLEAIRRGHTIWRNQRIERSRLIQKQSFLDIKNAKIDKEKLWLIGLALYWAEGAKEKEYKLGQGVAFSNSDPRMIKLFIKWLIDCIGVSKENIKLNIYIHDTHRNKSKQVFRFWSAISGFPESKFGKIYYKRHNLGTRRRNTGVRYNGLLRIRVARSTDLNRKIAGWIEGISLQCGIV